MFRLAHISDVHLGPLPKVSFAELASKRVTGYVNWRRNRARHLFGAALETVVEAIAAEGVDHLAITGDLVNLATSTEIETAKAWLSANFDPVRTTLVPGNHDAYVPGALRHAVRSWMPWIVSGGNVDTRRSTPFPTIARRGDVAIVGLSSANASLPFMATGDFSARQAHAAGRHLDEAGREGRFRVVLIHHPPVHGAAAWHKRLKGITRFRRMIRAHGAELVLHGHTHLDTLHHIAGPRGLVPVVGIASASQGPGGMRPSAAFNLFEISGGPGTWVLNHRRISLSGDGREMVENHAAPRIGVHARSRGSATG